MWSSSLCLRLFGPRAGTQRPHFLQVCVEWGGQVPLVPGRRYRRRFLLLRRRQVAGLALLLQCLRQARICCFLSPSALLQFLSSIDMSNNDGGQ